MNDGAIGMPTLHFTWGKRRGGERRFFGRERPMSQERNDVSLLWLLRACVSTALLK
jgi:hypothetical protein